MLRSVLAAVAIVVLTIAGLAVSAPGAAASGALSATAFAPSSTTVGASGVTFSASFLTATPSGVSAVTLTVPSGTAVDPAAGTPKASASAWTTSGSIYPIGLGSPVAQLSGTTLTVTFTGGSAWLPEATKVAVSVSGLKNPPTPVTSAALIKTWNGTTVVDQGTATAIAWTTGAATNAYWSPSSTATVTPADGVSESYGLTTARTATIDAVQLLLPPGTSGTPSLTSVTPAQIAAGGHVTLVGQLLTYAFPAASVEAGTPIAVTVAGLTNPTVAGAYPGVVRTALSSSAVDSAVAPAVSYVAGALTSLAWSPSSSTTGASGVAYAVDFTVADAGTYSSFVLNLPPGTTGTPVMSWLDVSPWFRSPSGVAVMRSGGQLVVSFDDTFMETNTVLSLQIDGLTNTSTSGAYAMPIAVVNADGRTIDAGVAPAVAFTSTALTSLSWSVSSTAAGAQNVTSTVGFGLGSAATLTAITMSVPPSTGGTPVVGEVTPRALAGGTARLVGQTLTYTLPAAQTVAAGTTVSVQLTGLSNTPTPQTYAATVTVLDAATTVSSGTTPSITFTASVLTALSWATTSTTAGTSTAYTFGFTTATPAPGLSSVTMTVPADTAGTNPTVGVSSLYSTSQGTKTLDSPTVSLAGTKLTVSFLPMYVDQGTQVSIQITGLTNTAAAGSYTSAITTRNNTGAIDSGTTPAVTIAGASLSNPGWAVSSTTTGAAGVGYRFTATPSAAMTLTSFRMTVPSGTVPSAGGLRIGAVQPAALAGGAAHLVGTTLTYTFPVTSLPAGTAVSLEIDNLTNTTVPGSYLSTITATNDGTPVASGTTAALGLTSTVLVSPTWSVSPAYAGASNASYTFGFTTTSAQTLTGVQFVLPAGIGATPSLTSVSAQSTNSGSPTLSGASVARDGAVLSLSFAGVNVAGGTAFTVVIGGMTNPTAPGSYTAAITTRNGAHSIDSGTTPAVRLNARYVSMSPPRSLSWIATALTGASAEAVDTVPADQGYSVTDNTGANAGWNVTVSATTFTDGTHTLPDTGTFSLNGSLASSASPAAPAVTCLTICTTPVNQISYPVPVTTAATSPAPTRIFSAARGSGAGSFAIGGSTSSAPLGWWVHVPASAYAGTYTSTITFSISAGP